mmetsp:Transcript_5653/g.15878  ORF Transcript_5653/g.15878 Transcript_5653/m.15878 type:complete len:506 (-) Transcript_5653:24-1541(-)
MNSWNLVGALAPCSALLLHVTVASFCIWSTGRHNFVDAFQPSCTSDSALLAHKHVPVAFNAMPLVQSHRWRVELYSQAGDDHDEEDEEEEDDEYIDDSSLGDWRAFRANLATSGISTQGDDQTSDKADSSDGTSSGTSKPIGGASSSESPETSSRPKSVSKRNEELLKSQNAELYKEYESGVWAHEAPAAEVGGLLCRLPLEAEIYRNAKYSAIGQKLQGILEKDDEDSTPSQDGGGLGSSPGVSFSLLGAKTLYWYRKARTLIEDETNKITSGAVGGEIDASTLPNESIDFLNLYLNHQDTWQEVCLVTEKNESGVDATLVLNRPMAFTLNDSIARLVLFGAYQGDLSPEEMELLVKFSIAFDKEIYCYLGGPDELDQNACILHGIADLKGSKEIAPNTGIFLGHRAAIEAAVTQIMQGMHSPSDFRFFVGKHRYLDGRLDLECVLGKYQPIACSRPIALKQCKALPKPLFHEVMELCGGELAELSKLELMKRDDVQLESVDDD